MPPLDPPSPDTPLAAAVVPRRRRGRPRSHTEPWTKVTVVLFDRQVAWLDRLADEIRTEAGASFTRAHLIRALVDALADAGLDPAGIRSDTDLRARLAAARSHPSSTSPAP